MVDIIVVEESLSESALACIAIALRRPSTRVAQARDLIEAKRMLPRQSAAKVLVILGWRALRNGIVGFVEAASDHATVIGFAPDLGQTARERAIHAGVQAIYHKPIEWNEYLSAVEVILNEWLPALARAPCK
jgi:hypothetical protein